MSWEKDYERWRDKGHTWGPGVDDVIELTEKERAAEEESRQAYEQKVKDYTVDARDECVKMGEELNEFLSDIKDVSINWREEYSRKAMDYCEQAAKSLGCSFELFGNEKKKEGCFAVGVDFYGHLSGKCGNVHRFAAVGVRTLEDCLQLVADFSAIGKEATTYFGTKLHFSTRDTAALRMELENWSKANKMSLPSSKKESLDCVIRAATETDVVRNSEVKGKDVEPER